MVGIEGDTIAAISTAPGVGAIAVVRVSGPGADAVLRALAPEASRLPAREPRLVSLRDPTTGEVIDRGLVTRFPAPASYTGEDLVEISGHGGWLGPELVVEACVAAGARRAEPGEFTRRAYLHGRVDLVQAEGVSDLIAGRSRALRRAALQQLDRGLSARIADLRSALVGVEALLVHHLDFPEEDDAPVPVDRIAARADEIAASLGALLETAAEGELLREGAMVVLAGLPNSGKSSLFNALLGQERAIVTEVPGTTRDAIEVTVSLGGFPFRLVDTAGLRDTADEVERRGIEVARRYLAAADVVLVCAEAGRDLTRVERGFVREVAAPVVVVRTKADLEGVRGDADEGLPPGAEATVRVSAFSGTGLGALRMLLPRLAYRSLVAGGGDAPVLTRERQRRGVAAALDEVRAFAAALRDGVGPEVAAAHLRPAESALEELLGVIGSEEVLDRVFADFCIGK